MVAVYKRLGFSMTGKMLRLAMPLRVNRKVKEWIANPCSAARGALRRQYVFEDGFTKGDGG